MKLAFEMLSAVPDSLGVLAEWYWKEWARYDGISVNEVKSKLKRFLSDTRAASLVCGFLSGNLVCCAQLKERENKDYPQFWDWVGGVFVHESYRNQGYGKLVIEEIIRHARSFGIEVVYLQTVRKDGGLYSSLGFAPVCEARHGRYEVMIMSKRIVEAR